MHVLRFILFSVVFLVFSISVGYAQVGIGTTNPNEYAALEINGDEGGLLMPRVSLTGTNDQTTIGTHEEGMVVYNTASGNGVSPGFYFNTGSEWVRFSSSIDPQIGWELTGNDIESSHFLGTTNDFPLRLRTNDLNRFTITNGDANAAGRLHSHSYGNAARPTYSWIGRVNTGMFSPSVNQVGFSTDGNERMRITGNGNVGIGTTSPSERVHIDGGLRLQGAFKPNNIPGGMNQILVSKGNNNAPAWGPNFENMGEIAGIHKFYAEPLNIGALSINTINLSGVPNMSPGAVVAVNWLVPPGFFDEDLVPGLDIFVEVVPENGQLKIFITNKSIYNLSGVQLAFIAYY